MSTWRFLGTCQPEQSQPVHSKIIPNQTNIDVFQHLCYNDNVPVSNSEFSLPKFEIDQRMYTNVLVGGRLEFVS